MQALGFHFRYTESKPLGKQGLATAFTVFQGNLMDSRTYLNKQALLQVLTCVP